MRRRDRDRHRHAAVFAAAAEEEYRRCGCLDTKEIAVGRVANPLARNAAVVMQ